MAMEHVDSGLGAASTVSARPPVFWLNLAVKAALVGLLLFAVVRSDLPQFQGKALTGRALTYPISTLIVPICWWVVSVPSVSG